MNCHKDLLVYDRCKLFIFFCIFVFITNKKTRHIASSQFIITLLDFVFFFICLLAITKIHVGLLLEYLLGFIFFLQGIWHCLIFI